MIEQHEPALGDGIGRSSLIRSSHPLSSHPLSVEHHSPSVDNHRESVENHHPRLLLHLCCAPCSTHVVQVLCEQFDVAGHFYNPNIHPEEEYRRRGAEMERYARNIALPLLVSPYEVQRSREAAPGETAPRARAGGLLPLLYTPLQQPPKAGQCHNRRRPRSGLPPRRRVLR